MSGVFGNIGKRLSDTLENAQKEIQQALIPNTTQSSTSSHETKGRSKSVVEGGGGQKSRLFGTILGRSQRMRDVIVDRRNPKSKPKIIFYYLKIDYFYRCGDIGGIERVYPY